MFQLWLCGYSFVESPVFLMVSSTGGYTMDYAQAQQICWDNGAVLATYSQMLWAQSQGKRFELIFI